jgi:hypothetical protein
MVPNFVLVSAYLLVIPLLAPFMKYQQSVCVTPQASDFPVLIGLYPLYFGILFSPFLLIALRNKKNMKLNQPVQPTSLRSAAAGDVRQEHDLFSKS